MGTTILLGQYIGAKKLEESGRVMGASIAFFISQLPNTTLFKVGLATPSSTVVQIVMCFVYYRYLKKKEMGYT